MDKSCSTLKDPQLRPVSVGVSLEFHLHLIACHICIFDDMSTF
jgi:hypothetical protein